MIIAAVIYILCFISFLLYGLVLKRRTDDIEQKAALLAQREAKLVDKSPRAPVLAPQHQQPQAANININEQETQKIVQNALSNLNSQIYSKIAQTVDSVDRQNAAFLATLSNTTKISQERASETLTQQVEKLLSDLTDNLKKVSILKEQEIDQTLTKRYKELEAEFEQHQQAKMAQIEKQAGEILMQVSKEVLPNAISPQDHNELIKEALARAKKKHFFN